MRLTLSLLDRAMLVTDPADVIAAIEALKRHLHGQLVSDFLASYIKTVEPVEPMDGCYTFQQFVSKIVCKRGKAHGYRGAYVNATQLTATPVTDTHFQRWRAIDRVPAWAYDLIDTMRFYDKCIGHKCQNWTIAEVNFLADEYLFCPTRSNRGLAIRCSKNFGRKISENAVRGQLDRLRKAGRVPCLRPGRMNASIQIAA